MMVHWRNRSYINLQIPKDNGDGVGDNQGPTPQPNPAPEEDTGSSSKSSGGFFDGLSLLILLTYGLFRRKRI